MTAIVEWLDQRNAIIDGGGCVVLKGIVRGASCVYGGMVTISAPTVAHFDEALILDEWIYRIDQ